MHQWLNYNHLFYFWVVSREKSITGASKYLRISQPTLSAQIKLLEQDLGARLFDRNSRGVVLTDAGKLVQRYANSIFHLGSELRSVMENKASSDKYTLRVGITDSVPKLITHATLLPVFRENKETLVSCVESNREDLVRQLGNHLLDVVISDLPFSGHVPVKAFNHLLVESNVCLYATRDLAERFPGDSPQRYNGAPFLLPAITTSARKCLDRWFISTNIIPRIVGEFDDSALLKTFGADGLGFFPVPEIVDSDVQSQYNVLKVDRLENITEKFFLISLEKKISNPGVALIMKSLQSQSPHSL